MLLQIITIARNAFVESIRQPVFFLIIAIAGIAQFFNTWGTAFSMGRSITTAEVGSDDKLLLDIGLSSVFVFGMLLAAFIATAVVSSEIEKKTVLTVVSKPVSRTAVILGKYLGVAGSILVGVLIMVMFLLLSIRHGVMSTAADYASGPVLLFGLGAVALSLGVAIWGNFFYGWYFSQTSMLVLAPLLVVAYIGTLVFDDTWNVQEFYNYTWTVEQQTYNAEEFVEEFRITPPESSRQIEYTAFKPQITMACAVMAMSMLVLTAIATAISTRLGQVMTIVISACVFVLGLLSNYLFGRHAFDNRPIAEIAAVERVGGSPPLSEPGGRAHLTLLGPRTGELEEGQTVYYGANPNGAMLLVEPAPPDREEATRKEEDLFSEASPPRIIAADVGEQEVTLRNVGRRVAHIDRLPEERDYLFTSTTDIDPAALVAWAVVPNMHVYWLVDAISQNRPVPASHMALVGAYSVAQIGVFLSLGIVLFQRRDVG